MKQIALIGLDHMGASIAIDLPKAGYLLNAFDLVQNVVDGLVAADASTARGAHDAVQDTDVIISILPVSQHVEGLYLDGDGLLARIAPGTLMLECLIIAPTPTRKAHAVTRGRGLMIFDVPVSGGIVDTAAGTLTFIIGGDAETLEEARPLFEAMGWNIFHAGPDGAGQVAKVCNNQFLAVLMIDTAEAMVLGVASGLEVKVLTEIIRRNSGGSWVLEVHNPWPGVTENTPTPRDCGGSFMAQLMIKDLRLA